MVRLLTMTDRVIQTGISVQFERGGEEHTGVVVAIDKCVRRGDMFGERVRQIPWADRAFVFLTLDTGYCYGTELL